MLLYNIPLLMVSAFLILTLIVGLSFSKRATIFREYAIGNRQFHTNTLVVTVLATYYGGGLLMREVTNVYEFGIRHMLTLFAVPLSLLIISLLALRMGPFIEHHLSIAETIGSVYGKYPRAIAALLGISISIGIVAIQINVMSAGIGICIDSIDTRIVTFFAALILITYAMLGGIRAITITDIFQFATFTITVPLIIKFLFVKTGKPFLEVICFLQQHEKFQFSQLFKLDKSLFKLVLNILWVSFFLLPSMVQRVYMSSGPIQAYKVFLRVALLSIIILSSIVLMGLFIFAGDATLTVKEIWTYILANMPSVYRGCVVISLLALTMSTADSNLQTAAVMFSHDIVESIQGTKSVPYVHQLRLAKLTSLVTGLLAMMITVCYPDLFQLSHFVFDFLADFFLVTVLPPFILAVFGFRGTSLTALIGMFTAILFDLAWAHWVQPAIEINSGCLPMLANGLAMMAAHYLLPQPPSKGWIGQTHEQKRMRQLMQAFKKYKKRIDLE